jgi:hypothetical protein
LKLVLAALTFFAFTPIGRGLDIQFDYSFDTNNFFVGHVERRAVLEAAAQAFEAHVFDALTGIKPGGVNHWKAIFNNPTTGAEVRVKDRSLLPDTLRVYVGARSLSGSTLGIGGPGGFTAKGTPNFLKKVSTRGQKGAGARPATDFGPWGGTLTFEQDADWYFDPDVTTIEPFGVQFDFYSIAVHELAHLFGFGTTSSWTRFADDGMFTGLESRAANFGLAVGLNGKHWADGTFSSVSSPVSLPFQEAAMDASLTPGTRRYFTALDYAALRDVGWIVMPEPGVASLLLMSSAPLVFRRKRRPRARHRS